MTCRKVLQKFSKLLNPTLQVPMPTIFRSSPRSILTSLPFPSPQWTANTSPSATRRNLSAFRVAANLSRTYLHSKILERSMCITVWARSLYTNIHICVTTAHITHHTTSPHTGSSRTSASRDPPRRPALSRHVRTMSPTQYTRHQKRHIF